MKLVNASPRTRMDARLGDGTSRALVLALLAGCGTTGTDTWVREAPPGERQVLRPSPLPVSARLGAARAETNAPAAGNDRAAAHGLLAPEVIRRVVMQNVGQVNVCYERGLAIDPNLTGRVIVRFVINGSGNVAAAMCPGDLPPVMRGVADCIAGAARSWQFPAPAGGGEVTVNYPFNLLPENPPSPAPRPPPL